MTQVNSNATPGKGKAFFDRADQVASTGNWDFAIEMYLEGIQREPDNVTRGHKPLREAAMKRKAAGGKAAGMMEQFKRKPGKDPLANLVNAEYLLAKDPGSVAFMDQAMVAAGKLELSEVAKMYADILLEAMRQAKKPSMKVLQEITQVYADMEEFASAIAACEMALQVDPDNGQIQEILRTLSAKYTIKKGKYDQEGSFTKGVKDLDKQKELLEQDAMVQSKDHLQRMVERSRKEYLASPTVPGKINGYVEALLKLEDESYENEAIDVLLKAHKELSAYQFKQKVGEIKIRQMSRRYHKLLTSGDKQAAAEHARKQLELELQEYQERAVNYPTDLAIKFELGRRQFLAAKDNPHLYDDAIATLQQAQRDPRRHVAAMNYLGLAFAHKGWYREAAETFEKVLQVEMTEDRNKEIRYNYGTVLDKMVETLTEPAERKPVLLKAQEQFSEVAQMDFTYKDTRNRLEGVRKKLDALE